LLDYNINIIREALSQIGKPASLQVMPQLFDNLITMRREIGKSSHSVLAMIN
jgi:hypothetical protein